MRGWLALAVTLRVVLDALALRADPTPPLDRLYAAVLQEDCRIEFISPAPGEQLVAGEDLVVELSVVGCPNLSEDLEKILEWNGGELMRFYTNDLTVTMPGVPPGHHTLFALVSCEAPCLHAVNGTALLSVKSAPPPQWPRLGGSQLAQVKDSVAALLGDEEATSWRVPRAALAAALEDFVPMTAPPNPDPTAWLHVGRLLQAAGRFDAAAGAFRAAIMACPAPPGDDALAVDACAHLTQTLEMRAALPFPQGIGPPAPPARADAERAYLAHLRAMLPLAAGAGAARAGAGAAPTVAFGVVSGSGLYRSRARAVAETWLASVAVGHIYGDANASLPARLCSRDADGAEECVASSFRAEEVPVPDGPGAAWLAAAARRDDFFSSVPKFVLALLALLRAHPRHDWYFLAGCDTYVFPRAVEGAVRGIDARRERVLLGGHAGVHGAGERGGTLFLSGGSGLLFSHAFASALAPEAPALLRRWIERDGAAARCAPCADLAFAHFAALLGARVEQRPCFYAFWPQYYLAAQPEGAPGEIGWRAGAGELPARCAEARVDVRGLGVSASSWWAKTEAVCEAPVAFHYLQPRAMRMLHSFAQERA